MRYPPRRPASVPRLFGDRSSNARKQVHGHLRATLPVSMKAGTQGIFAGVLARRKPRLLLRFRGSLSLRLAERNLVGLLFHEPPRTTRRSLFGLLPLKQ